MRLHPPTTILLLVGASFAAMAIFGERPQEFDDERCNVARDYISSLLEEEALDASKPIVLNLEPELLAASAAQPSSAQEQPDPLAGVFTGLERDRNTPLHEACPGIVDPFDRVKLYEDSDEANFEIGEYDRIYLSLSVPAISNDASLALLASGLVFAPLDGIGLEVVMMKDKLGVWRVVSEQGTWIS